MRSVFSGFVLWSTLLGAHELEVYIIGGGERLTPSRAIRELICDDDHVKAVTSRGVETLEWRSLEAFGRFRSQDENVTARAFFGGDVQEIRVGELAPVPLMVHPRELAGASETYVSPDLGAMVAKMEYPGSVSLFLNPTSEDYTVTPLPFAAHKLADAAWPTPTTVLLALGSQLAIVEVSMELRTFKAATIDVPAQMIAVFKPDDAWILGYDKGYHLTHLHDDDIVEHVVIQPPEASAAALKTIDELPLIMLLNGTLLAPTAGWTVRVTPELPKGTYAQQFCAARSRGGVRVVTLTLSDEGVQMLYEARIRPGGSRPGGRTQQ